MSKAFTRDDVDVPEVLPLAMRGEPGETLWVTPDGYRAVHQELARLVEDHALATAQSDSLTGLARRREVEGRIQVLQSRLAVVTPAPAPRDEEHIYFGAFVKVRDGQGRVRTYRLVGAHEVDAAPGNISVQSPIAKELLGKRVGDTVDVELPRGDEELTVLAVRYPG